MRVLDPSELIPVLQPLYDDGDPAIVEAWNCYVSYAGTLDSVYYMDSDFMDCANAGCPEGGRLRRPAAVQHG